MIWLKKSKIRGIHDLEGKTIAVPGIPYQEDLLESVLTEAGLKLEDVEVQRVAYELVPTLLQRKADAIFGGSWNIEGIALREHGARPVVRRVQELGIPSYDELVVITRADRVAKEPRAIRDFISALSRAVAMVKRDPEAAVELIEASNSALGHEEVEAQVKATIPLMSASAGQEP
jgi:putative hydroxymethylpyrimidine transport system substrate-binding protein